MKIIYDTENLELRLEKASNLLEACLQNNVPIDHSCEGMASCGTCRVIVIQDTDKLHPRNELEQEMANDRSFSQNERLACQLKLNQSIYFKLPKD